MPSSAPLAAGASSPPFSWSASGVPRFSEGSRPRSVAPVIRRNARRGSRARSSTATSSALTPSTRAAAGPLRGGAGRRCRLQGLDGHREGVGQRGAGLVGAAEAGADRVGLPAHHHELRLVRDRAVVGDPVELVARGLRPDLGDAQLDLERLLLLDERGPEELGVGVGQPAAGDVAPVVGVAADVREPDTVRAQRLELVVPADRREPDPVVDLRDLAQRRRVVLRDEQHTVGEGEHHDAAATGDPLAGQLRAVAQELVDGGVERHRHGAAPGCAGEESSGGTGSGQPPGRVERPVTTAVVTSAMSASGWRTAPSPVIETTTG